MIREVHAFGAAVLMLATHVPAQACAQSARRPVVAIIADSAGTELTDFMVPHAALTEAGVARVITVARREGRIRLVPGRIHIEPDLTMAAFDAANPRGADYVIVPAIVDHENATVVAWIRDQAAHGATIVSICEGARTAAMAGVFKGRRATSHWSALDDLAKKYPGTTWVRNQRYVVDDHVISTTGVSASLPASMFLIQRIGGRELADSVARRMGIESWSPEHDTDSYRLTKWVYVKAAWNYVAWWRHDEVGVHLADGFDEVALALTVDAIARTIRGKPFTWSEDGAQVRGRQGLRVSVDRSRAEVSAGARELPLPASPLRAAGALDAAIAKLTKWYGSDAANLIEMGMEYSPSDARPEARKAMDRPASRTLASPP